MKRTNVVLDEGVLEEALQLSGQRTYSATINHALSELIRLIKLRRRINALQGTGDVFWPGYVEEMVPDYRGPDRAVQSIRDAPLPPKSRKRRRAAR